MPHFGIICPPIPGHVNPLAAVGRALIRKGHQVTFIHVPDMAAKAAAEGLAFTAIGAAEFPPGTLSESVSTLAALSGIKALRYSVHTACRIARSILQDAPAAVQTCKIDALLVDQNEPAGATVAEHLGIPFLSVCTSLPLNREPGIPPPFVGWPFNGSLFGRIRNTLGLFAADRLIAPIQTVLNEYRQRWNLPLVHQPDDTFSRRGTIAQMPRELDFPRRSLQPEFHYLGPWFDDQSSSRVPFPFHRLDGRPLVYGSLGTLQSRDSHYFRTMAQACSDREVQLVLSLGSASQMQASLPDLPGDPIVVNFAPQLELLPRASVTITHAGMNTTVQSLYFGVPLVAIPLAHDQPAIAARVAAAGVGITIPPAQLSVIRLKAAIDSLLASGNPWRESAARMRIAIADAGGALRAVELAEQLVKGNYLTKKSGAS